MTLETLFYTLGIISMIFMLLVILGVVVMIMRVKSSIQSFRDGFAGKIIGILREKNMKVASALGLTLAHYFMNSVKKNIADKSQPRDRDGS